MTRYTFTKIVHFKLPANLIYIFPCTISSVLKFAKLPLNGWLSPTPAFLGVIKLPRSQHAPHENDPSFPKELPSLDGSQYGYSTNDLDPSQTTLLQDQ